jgi:hypothetical protein
MLEHVIDEVEMRTATIETGVDVRETDIYQPLCLIDMGRNYFQLKAQIN